MTNVNLLYELYDSFIKYSLFIVIIFKIHFLIGNGEEGTVLQWNGRNCLITGRKELFYGGKEGSVFECAQNVW
jgi:hypothetical protein